MKNKVIIQYYVLSSLLSLFGLSVIAAIYVTFLMSKGLSLFDVNFVNATFFATLVICEIPTGAFADLFGRKKSFMLSCAALSASMFIYGVSETTFGFIIAEIFAGIGVTFKNGAIQAWLVDSLKHEGYTGDITKIFGRQNMICLIFACFGAIGGARLVTIDPTFPWYLGGTMLLILTGVVGFVMNEDYFVKQEFSFTKGLKCMKDVAVKSVKYAVEHESVRFVLVSTFLQVLAVQAFNMFWQPRFKNLGLAEQNFGYVLSGVMACLALGSFAATRLKSRLDERTTLLMSQLVLGIIMIAASFMTGLTSTLLVFLAHEIPRGFWDPIKEGYLQKRIPSEERATISSFCSTAPHIGGVIGLLVSGGIAEMFGITVAWFVSGVILVVGSIFIARKK